MTGVQTCALPILGDAAMDAAADELTRALAARWDGDLGTWVDAGPAADGSGRCRTAEALLPLLVDWEPVRVACVLAQLEDSTAHGGPAGPTGVHRAEPVFDPTGYWRGPVWPQLAYLLVLAAGHHDPAAADPQQQQHPEPPAAIECQATRRGRAQAG